MSTIINFLFAAVKSGAPLLLGTTGEIITEKSGSLNLGVEGIMALGAFAGYYAGYKSGSLVLAIFSAFLMGALAGLIFAVLTVTLQANQNVTGLTLTIFGSGVALFFGEILIKQRPKLSGAMNAMLSGTEIPLLSKIPAIGRILFSQNILVYLSIIIAVLCGIYLKYTRAGLKVRAVGENPAAADASGINVTLTKYINIMLGGGICGIGGAYLALINGRGDWDNNAVSGQGWISVALVIFARWSPFGAILGSLVFGAFYVFQIRVNDIVAAFPFLGFLSKIPNAFYSMLPFVITALVLVISSVQKKKIGVQPSSCGINYYREDR
ncbi:MAG: ABC transporter permease [Clostridiales bacterium]|jgi:simple sugar transport system permease protein|nr:ABC transporter permease [Clostridiales bacterium]